MSEHESDLRPGEIMKPIKGYEGVYGITNHGRVWSYPKQNSNRYCNGRWLKPSVGSRSKKSKKRGGTGYHVVQLYRNNKFKSSTVHRLVAVHFIKPPTDPLQKCINHIDGDKANNHIDNLEWCSYSENINHAIKNGLLTYKRRTT